MFVNIMRSNQRWLMGIISVLVIISFIWFYSDRTQADRIVSDHVGTIYGRNLSNFEVERIGRQLRIAAELGLMNLVNRDVTDQRNELETIVNHLVIAHQAEEMGIYPSDAEVVEAEQKLPVFQGTNGQFDLDLYKQFVSEKLPPSGFSEDQMTELVRENLQFGKLRAIVDAPVVFSPVEARLAYEQEYAKTNASVVRLAQADFTAGAKEPTEDEIKKYYEDQKGQYIQPEKRKVAYAKFGLTDAQKKLVGKPKMDALQPLANGAVALLTDLLDNKGKADFAVTAAQANVPVKETPEFEQTQTAGLEEAGIPGFARAAFKLTKNDPDSDVPLQTPDGFYDLHLVSIVPARPLTLDEARPKVVAAIKEERVRAAVAAKAEEIRAKVADGLKAGRSFADAARDAGQTAQDIPGYSPAEPPQATPDGEAVAEATQELGAGELSKFVPTPSGGLLVYVRNREGIDEGKFEQQNERLGKRMEQQKAAYYFAAWLSAARNASNADIVPRSRRG